MPKGKRERERNLYPQERMERWIAAHKAIYIYMYRQREKDREIAGEREVLDERRRRAGVMKMRKRGDKKRFPLSRYLSIFLSLCIYIDIR